jgi:hypothetical protein
VDERPTVSKPGPGTAYLLTPKAPSRPNVICAAYGSWPVSTCPPAQKLRLSCGQGANSSGFLVGLRQIARFRVRPWFPLCCVPPARQLPPFGWAGGHVAVRFLIYSGTQLRVLRLTIFLQGERRRSSFGPRRPNPYGDWRFMRKEIRASVCRCPVCLLARATQWVFAWPIGPVGCARALGVPGLAARRRVRAACRASFRASAAWIAANPDSPWVRAASGADGRVVWLG